jgi:acyl CoA:acetate/3-ketoacid CoA transferase beta subunit
MTDVTRAEVCAAAIADAFAAPMAGRSEVMVSPMGLLPTLGARLARLTSNPDLLLTDGEARILAGVPPLGSTQEVVEGWMPFRLVLEAVVPFGRRHVMMGASQVDREGNQNISAIGPWARPDRMLLGVRGGPGNTVNNRTSYWVPKQSTRVFVESVDVVSGVGRTRAEAAGKAATRFHDLHRLVTNLGVYDFAGPGGTVRLVTTHPGVTVADCQAASGFELALPSEGGVPATREPTSEELVLIREVLDPGGLREREVPPADVTQEVRP